MNKTLSPIPSSTNVALSIQTMTDPQAGSFGFEYVTFYNQNGKNIGTFKPSFQPLLPGQLYNYNFTVKSNATKTPDILSSYEIAVGGDLLQAISYVNVNGKTLAKDPIYLMGNVVKYPLTPYTLPLAKLPKPSSKPDSKPDSKPSSKPGPTPTPTPKPGPKPVPTPIQPTPMELFPKIDESIDFSTNLNLVTDIKQLQSIEQELFKNLSTIINTDLSKKPLEGFANNTNTSTTPSNDIRSNNPLVEDNQQINDILNQINQLTEVRVNLYKQLKEKYQLSEQLIQDDDEILANHIAMIKIVEQQLNQMKENIQNIKTNKSNQVRMIQLSNYEFDRYEAHKKVMRIIFVVFLIIAICSILLKQGILPSPIATGIIGIVLIIGLGYGIKQVFDLQSRNNFNYNQYDFIDLGIGSGYDSSNGGVESVYEHDKKALEKLISGMKTEGDNLITTTKNNYHGLEKRAEASYSNTSNKNIPSDNNIKIQLAYLTKDGFNSSNE